MKIAGKHWPFKSITGVLLVVAVAGLLLGCVIGTCASWASQEGIRGGSAHAGQDLVAQQDPSGAKTSPAAPGSSLRVAFRQDPSFTRGLYMGDLWVSPLSFTAVGEGKEVSVYARVEGLGTKREQAAEWMSEDPKFATVTPSRGMMVRIIVRHAGQGTVKVTTQGASRVLTIKAAYKNGSMRVEIS